MIIEREWGYLGKHPVHEIVRVLVLHDPVLLIFFAKDGIVDRVLWSLETPSSCGSDSDEVSDCIIYLYGLVESKGRVTVSMPTSVYD